MLVDGVSSQRVGVESGNRFEFGKNWSHFLTRLNEQRITEAENSLKAMLETQRFDGQSFLDVGSGSGLFSLAARRLGAAVHSFDFDPESVACTRELYERFFPGDRNWTVEQESALNSEYLNSLGKFDVVYSWGVLHHTGDMWQALENVHAPVAPRGKLFIAIYNDMGSQSTRWRTAKRIYNKLPRFLKTPFALLTIAPPEGKEILKSLLSLQPQRYVQRWTNYDQSRGMSLWHDLIDWVGGYPYEVASPEQIFDFYKARDFELMKLKSGSVGLGCNEFVFRKQ